MCEQYTALHYYNSSAAIVYCRCTNSAKIMLYEQWVYIQNIHITRVHYRIVHNNKLSFNNATCFCAVFYDYFV